MSQTAIILGATGLVGNHLLDKLSDDNSFSKIILFSRNSVQQKHDKIEEHLIDLFELQDYSEAFQANVVFCCIGTTKSKTPDKNQYRKIDYGIPVEAAKLAGKNCIPKFLSISSLGADYKSAVFYNRIKGEMERDVQFYHNHDTYLFRPSLISGKRDKTRVAESLAKGLFKVINPVIPKKYSSIHPKTIAEAMVKVSKNGYGQAIISSDKIHNLAK